MRFFLSLRKHFGRVFLSVACLLLQGCNNWFSSKSPEVVTNENSTVVGTSENEAVTDVSEEPIKPVRATPRRPVVVEEPVFEPIPVDILADSVGREHDLCGSQRRYADEDRTSF